MAKVREKLQTLYKANIHLKAGQCQFAKEQIEWLGFEMTNTRASPVNDKMQGTTKKLGLSNLKGLRSYLGAVNKLNNFIPNLAALCFLFGNIVKKDANWFWSDEPEKAFTKKNEEVKKVADLPHLKQDRKQRKVRGSITAFRTKLLETSSIGVPLLNGVRSKTP